MNERSVSLMSRRRASGDVEVIEPLVAAMAASEEEDVTAMASELVRSFEAWKVHERQPRAVLFYFAGAEVEPWVPALAWSHGFGDFSFDGRKLSSVERLRREGPGFEPRPLLALHDAADSTDLAELEVFDALRDLFTAETLSRCAAALEQACSRRPFADPISFFVAPGHDEPHRLVLERA